MNEDFPLTCEAPSCTTVVAFIRIVGAITGRPIVRYRVTEACAIGPLSVMRCRCHSHSLAPVQPIPRPVLPFPVRPRTDSAPPKRGRGRPRKEEHTPRAAAASAPPKRGRGRPRKEERKPLDAAVSQMLPTKPHLIAEATENRADLTTTFRVRQDATILVEQRIGMADFLAQVRLVDTLTAYYRASGYDLAMNDRWKGLLS